MDKSQGIKDTYRMMFPPKDVKTDKWKEDIREWQQVECSDIYNYLILSRAWTTKKNTNQWTVTIILKSFL